MAKFGFGALDGSFNNSTSGTSKTLDALKLANLNSTGRVLSVVLDDSHPKYKELGGPKAIGAVEIIDLSGGTGDYSTVSENQNYKVAYPLQPGIKNYPLVNEVVYLVSQPTKKIMQRNSAKALYYISVVNLWNHPHHNAIPYSAGSLTPENSKNYQDSALGSTNKLTDTSGTIRFGKYFKERSDIYPLQPFEGDLIYEGRWGNSIRLSGTAPDKNPWSTVGTQGDAITIIRNGQTDNPTKNGWDFTVEDINTDASSIYLTTTQKVPLLANTNYFSYKSNPPTLPDEYTGKQVIINSGRLVFNTTEDHLLLSSAKSISLSSAGTVNIDASEMIIQTSKIYLGSKSAKEPLLLGDTTVELLKTMIDVLKELVTASLKASNSGGPIPSLNKKAPALLKKLLTLNPDLLKSNSNFTV
jgi:hypothetical protein